MPNLTFAHFGTTIEERAKNSALAAYVPIDNGLFLILTDTHRLCYDFGNTRLFLGDIEEIATEAAREAITSPLDKFYFVKEDAKLWRYAGGVWHFWADGESVSEHVEQTILSANGVHGLKYNPTTGVLFYLDANEQWQTILFGGSSVVSATLASTGWNDHSQTLAVSGVTGTSNGTVGLAQNISSTAYDAASRAVLRISAQGTDSVTITADGEVPSVDIPVVFILFPQGSAADGNGWQPKILETPLSIGGDERTTVETALAALNSLLATAEMHGNIFRGKYLGNAVTAEQYAAITAGTFDDLYIGDYWTIGGVNYRIADIDYWYGKGDTACSKHHVVIVPDTNLASAKMNNTNTTGSDPGGYIGSDFKTGANSNTGLATATTAINNAFGASHILSKRLLFTNKVANGIATAGNWYDSTIDLMNEINVYGSYIFTPAPNGSTIPYNYTTDHTQLALFRMAPKFICNRSYWWLRDVVSAAYFAYVSYDGHADSAGASRSHGVRPAFAIC